MWDSAPRPPHCTNLHPGLVKELPFSRGHKCPGLSPAGAPWHMASPQATAQSRPPHLLMSVVAAALAHGTAGDMRWPPEGVCEARPVTPGCAPASPHLPWAEFTDRQHRKLNFILNRDPSCHHFMHCKHCHRVRVSEQAAWVPGQAM